jgi:hypothetical protein
VQSSLCRGLFFNVSSFSLSFILSVLFVFNCDSFCELWTHTNSILLYLLPLGTCSRLDLWAWNKVLFYYYGWHCVWIIFFIILQLMYVKMHKWSSRHLSCFFSYFQKACWIYYISSRLLSDYSHNNLNFWTLNEIQIHKERNV